MEWPEILSGLTTPQYPNTDVVRFVNRNYRHKPNHGRIRFLDIGCGLGANSIFLWNEGYEVDAVDPSGRFPANYCDKIERVELTDQSYDCIIDCNTLCHVESPPIAKIKRWLKPGGVFFAIAPTSETARGHLEGKGFVRCATEEQIRKLYEPRKLGQASYPTDEGQIYSWIIEA